MATTNFVDGTTVVQASWLNDVDEATYGNIIHLSSFGAVGDGVTDDTAAIQAAVAHAQSLVQASAVNAAIYDVGGAVIDGGNKVYSITSTIIENVGCVVFQNMTITTNFAAAGSYAGGWNAAFVIGSGSTWAPDMGLVNWRNGMRHVKIQKGTSHLAYGVILTGLRDSLFEDVKFEQEFCGFFLENVSECAFVKCINIGSYYGFILDGRTTAASPLGFTRTNNDVSNNNFHQCSAQFSQHSGWLAISTRQNRYLGCYSGFWAAAPLGSPPLNFPTTAAGLHIVNSNTEAAHNDCYYSVHDGFLFEADPSISSDCIRITAPTSSGGGEGGWPICDQRFINCYAQTYANNYTAPLLTTFAVIEGSSTSQLEGIIFDSCGFTYLTGLGLLPPFMRQEGNVLMSGVTIKNCSHAASLNGDGLGHSILKDMIVIEDVDMEAVGWPNANGWTGNVLYITAVGGTGASGVAKQFQFGGLTGKAAAYKPYNFRSLKYKVGYVVLSFDYTGTTPPIGYFQVNGDALADSSVVNTDTQTYFTNATRLITSNSGRATYLFRPFDTVNPPFTATTPFDSVTVFIGVDAPNPGVNTKISNVTIGYIPLGSMKNFPAGVA
jgi:hypothetical protein